MDKPSREHFSRSPPDEDHGQNSRQFKGIRIRKWGRWVSEIRMPKSRDKIWLGSYKTAEQAARAYDAAVYCLRGPNAKLNFPDSVPAIPSASSLSREEIQVAAAKYALGEIPSTSFALQNISDEERVQNISDEEREKPASPSRPSSVSETKRSCDSQQVPEAQDLMLWESPSDSYGGLNLEKIPSIDEVLALEFIPSLQEEQQQGYIFFDPTDLWN